MVNVITSCLPDSVTSVLFLKYVVTYIRPIIYPVNNVRIKPEYISQKYTKFYSTIRYRHHSFSLEEKFFNIILLNFSVSIQKPAAVSKLMRCVW